MKMRELLKDEIHHVSIRSFNATKIIEQYSTMACQARNLALAASISGQMVKDTSCSIILSLSGSLVSAGLRQVIVDLLRCSMVDVIVSTGANIVDQDFFEALGYRHYRGDSRIDDQLLKNQGIDRMYDTFVKTEECRACDEVIKKIADDLPPEPHSSRDFIREMGKYLIEKKLGKDSIVRVAHERGVPIFVPAFSDCSAGFGLAMHQHALRRAPKLSIDSAKDLLELARIKAASKDTGLFIVGGGSPKNFAQDVSVAAALLGRDVQTHKYAIQLSVADERCGSVSGSSLREAHAWGKGKLTSEQSVFCEATLGLPLIVSSLYHQGSWRKRRSKKFSMLLDSGKI